MSNWKLVLSNNWDVLGPFPIHAREQHFLSPSFPLDLSDPINLSKSWPSSYADAGHVSWSTAQSDDDGMLQVSFPNIRWKSLRNTEGWAALQHHAVLRTYLTVYPPSSSEPVPLPHLLINLIHGSFLTIIPTDTANRKNCTPEWLTGNIYDMERALPRIVNLPSMPSLTQPTIYHIIVSGDYEIRLFGDPNVQGSETPVQTIHLTVEFGNIADPVVYEPSQNVICNFIDGIAFGHVIGVGIRGISGWWSVKGVVLRNATGITLKLQNEVPIAPSQLRIVPLLISQYESFSQPELQICLELVSAKGETRTVAIVIPIKHLSCWDAYSYDPIITTYLYSLTMPTVFVAVPPILPNSEKPQPPILALHGAGVDILKQPFWVDSLPRNKHSWIVVPTGRTSWGLDWHGPSALDAWGSVDALFSVLKSNNSWKPWEICLDSQVVILGHSNGGQGAWYLASRYPDRVLGVIPAAAYIKSQAYVPLTMSRSAHYIDPALRSILDSSLTPDDNDLYLSNLVDTPVLAIHGGIDDNVPVWHSREAVNILQTSLSNAHVIFREDVGRGHWYPSVFNNEQVQLFLDSILTDRHTLNPPKEFTLTVSIPAESGSLRGWKIESLLLPGRLARLHVRTDESGLTKILTSNVDCFSLDCRMYDCATVWIGDSLMVRPAEFDGIVYFKAIDHTTWEVSKQFEYASPPSRMQSILTSVDSIVFIVSDTIPSRGLSVALRIIHDLNLYHRLDAEIILEAKALGMLGTKDFPSGNIVFIGDPLSIFARAILDMKKTPFEVMGSFLALNGQVLDDPDTAAMFLHPHPTNKKSNMLFLLAGNLPALERAARLFPIRTGITVPSWIVISGLLDKFGAAGLRGLGVWSSKWGWSQPLSMWA